MTRLGVWIAEPFSSAEDHPFAASIALAQAAEESGFDSLWVSDNVRDLDHPTAAVPRAHEAYSLLGALAPKTRSIRLGAFPAGVVGRAPAVLAKVVTGLDVISHGRAILSVVSSPESDGKDGDRLTEEIQVCRAVLDDDLPEFIGRHYRVQGAFNQPRPLQRAGIPIVVIIESDDDSWSPARSAGLRIAGRYADAVVVGGNAALLGEVADIVKSAPRDQREYARPGSTEVIWAGKLAPGHAATVGEPTAVSAALAAQQFRERLRAGADGCIICLTSLDALETIAQVGPGLSEVVRGTSAEPR